MAAINGDASDLKVSQTLTVGASSRPAGGRTEPEPVHSPQCEEAIKSGRSVGRKEGRARPAPLSQTMGYLALYINTLRWTLSSASVRSAGLVRSQ